MKEKLKKKNIYIFKRPILDPFSQLQSLIIEQIMEKL